MTFKPGSIKNVTQQVPELNRTIAKAYRTRLESVNKRETTGVTSYTYQSAEHGQVDFSANSSPSVANTYALAEKQGTIIYANAHSTNTSFDAHVTDVTSTSVTIELITKFTSATAGSTATAFAALNLPDFSAVTTGTVRVYYQVIGSNP